MTHAPYTRLDYLRVYCLPEGRAQYLRDVKRRRAVRAAYPRELTDWQDEHRELRCYLLTEARK